jgi:hypothetical protein
VTNCTNVFIIMSWWMAKNIINSGLIQAEKSYISGYNDDSDEYKAIICQGKTWMDPKHINSIFFKPYDLNDIPKYLKMIMDNKNVKFY